MMIKDILTMQLALDYCCSPSDVLDNKNHFTEYVPMDGRRQFEGNTKECFLKIAVVYGKVLVTGKKEIIGEMEQRFKNQGGAWFMEIENLVEINRMIEKYGYKIETTHPFYIADQKSIVDTDGYDIQWYGQDEILQFQNDERIDEAFAFVETAPDMLGVSASRDGELIGMAGASADSPYMWQIGINVMPGSEANGVGSMLVSLLKNAILDKGILPFYGMSMSHIASQRVALKAGFLPMWVELITSKM